MKYKNLLFLSFSLLSLTGNAQSNKAYAITGQSSANFNWVDIREIDLSTGTATKTVFESGKTPFSLIDYNRHINFMPTAASSLGLGLQDQSSTNVTPQNMVAAAAFDEKHNKLFFMPLRGGELSWLDLSSNDEKLKFFTAESALPGINFNDEANSITRMVIGADGNGYAITNDGNHLIQFTTGNKVEVKDLGSLIDADANKSFSIHNKCSSWGGDIVGDAYGKLYLFTAAHNIFLIDVKSRIASYKGAVINLPGTFATNGAAVDKNDNVIVSSANNFEGFYKINMNDLKATKLVTTGQVFNASDLANGNLLYQNKAIKDLQSGYLVKQEIIGNDYISVYPNPVTGTECKISFDKMKPGTYYMILTDLQGRAIINRQIYLKTGSQIESLGLKRKPASGMYMIKIADSNNKSVFSDKIVIN